MHSGGVSGWVPGRLRAATGATGRVSLDDVDRGQVGLAARPAALPAHQASQPQIPHRPVLHGDPGRVTRAAARGPARGPRRTGTSPRSQRSHGAAQRLDGTGLAGLSATLEGRACGPRPSRSSSTSASSRSSINALENGNACAGGRPWWHSGFGHGLASSRDRISPHRHRVTVVLIPAPGAPRPPRRRTCLRSVSAGCCRRR